MTQCGDIEDIIVSSATNAEHITKNLFQYMTHYYSHPKSKHLFIKEVPNSKSKVRYYKVLL